jgi:hypothetical protein
VCALRATDLEQRTLHTPVVAGAVAGKMFAGKVTVERSRSLVGVICVVTCGLFAAGLGCA